MKSKNEKSEKRIAEWPLAGPATALRQTAPVGTFIVTDGVTAP